METLRTVVLVLAIILILVSGICYLKARKKLKTNKEIIKNELEKYIKIYSIILVVAVILGITAIILNIIFDKNVATTITLDINPSIELKLDGDKKVMGATAINDDAIGIVKGTKGKNIDEAIGLIVENLLEKGTIHPGEEIDIILYSEGDLKSSEIMAKINHSFNAREVRPNIFVVEKVTDEDLKFAKKNNMGVGKAAYISALIKENSNINPELLIDKSVNEIRETKETGYYCDLGYTLEGDLCVKKVSSEEPVPGEVCEDGYYLYNGTCYLETSSIEGNKDTCSDGFKLENNMCVLKSSHNATGICESGNYDDSSDYCTTLEYFGDATEYCRDPGRTLYDHKCLATKPTINGGCLGSDLLYKGKCVNTKNDYYVSEWKCPGWNNNAGKKGEIMEDYKCYRELKVKPIKYVCDDDFTLDGRLCVREDSRPLEKERLCPKEYTKVDGGRCINMGASKPLIEGNTCEKENARLEDNKCVIYDIVRAYK